MTRTRNGAQPLITAVLGPTNTGKTYFAIERMLAHRSGMIGLPLRLLAREVYDRVCREKGAGAAALITGEEKIIPPGARFFVCTVEAMPLEIPVACLVIDEIQLCADPDRGHIFTDRLLHARGQEETMFLGSDTMRGPIQRFAPRAWFVTRPRLSDLAYAGAKKLTRLPRRSAVVGFSAEDVYGLAEVIRHRRGGAAVVMGALSPRTRNAQVALYQSGEVDFLVATDAIGMGLNMDIDHVAFAGLEKFDGAVARPLYPQEIGQIAGRAGRHMKDGTFGVTDGAEPPGPETVARVENHRYEPVTRLQWRNAALDFRSLSALLESLDAPPSILEGGGRGLVRARAASDVTALRLLGAREEIRKLAGAREMLMRLWDVCQLPDFNKLSIDEHLRLVETIFRHLAADGVLPDDWLARRINRLDIVEGDVATLSGRLAQIRTYTYAAHRPDWTRDGAHWQGVARAVEDRLSDALHERLIQRFIDRRTALLVRHMNDDEPVTLDASGAVFVGGESIGRLDGFRFAPDPRGGARHAQSLRTAALRGLESEIAARARRLGDAPDEAITFSAHGKLWWDGAIVASLVAGTQPLAPRIRIAADEGLAGPARESVAARLDAWLAARIRHKLAPLLLLREGAEARAGTAEALPGPARGLAHRLCESFGSLERGATAPIGELRRQGVRFGRRTIFLPALLRPDPAALLGLLWGVWSGRETLPAPPPPGITSFARDAEMPETFLAAAGYRVLAGRAVRFDILERLEDELEKGAAMQKLVSLLGSSHEELHGVLAALGWHSVETDNGPAWRRARRRPPRARPRPHGSSPFEGLAHLIGAK